MADLNTRSSWDDDDTYWRKNFRNRPYASTTGRDYDYYQPGYRYGYEAANRFESRSWDDVERDLSRDWDNYEFRGTSTWEQIKGAVRDAWDRVTGRRTVSTR
jgi:hypothetical protein